MTPPAALEKAAQLAAAPGAPPREEAESDKLNALKDADGKYDRAAGLRGRAGEGRHAEQMKKANEEAGAGRSACVFESCGIARVDFFA